jgi:methylenetetrahydrofolate reductase (NADPH)
VQRTLMIAGDLPEPRGPFSASIEVLETGVLQKHGLRAISVAGHPEGHPVVAADVMERALKAKLDFARREGIEVSVITQFCFEAAPITDYVRRLRTDGIGAPVRVGVAGPAGLMTLVKYGMRCGVGNSLRALRSKADIFGRLASDTPPDEILNEVAAAEAAGTIDGIAGVHFYVFGGLRKTGQWLRTALAR